MAICSSLRHDKYIDPALSRLERRGRVVGDLGTICAVGGSVWPVGRDEPKACRSARREISTVVWLPAHSGINPRAITHPRPGETGEGGGTRAPPCILSPGGPLDVDTVPSAARNASLPRLKVSRLAYSRSHPHSQKRRRIARIGRWEGWLVGWSVVSAGWEGRTAFVQTHARCVGVSVSGTPRSSELQTAMPGTVQDQKSPEGPAAHGSALLPASSYMHAIPVSATEADPQASATLQGSSRAEHDIHDARLRDQLRTVTRGVNHLHDQAALSGR